MSYKKKPWEKEIVATARDNGNFATGGGGNTVPKVNYTPPTALKEDVKPSQESGSTNGAADDALKLIYSGANATNANEYYKRAETPFSFSLDGNALYNQYKDHYTKQAQLGMEDAIGRASALTGGYANSYAMNVGQQAYYNKMDELNAVIPELYNMAYNQWLNERDHNLAMGDRYSNLKQAEVENYLAYLKAQENPEAEKAPESVIKAVMGITNNDELERTLSGFAAAGIISGDMAGAILNEMENKTPSGMMTNPASDFSLVDKGDDRNWFGIDKDVTVKLPNGEVVTLKELREMLIKEGYKRKDANKAINKLMAQLDK